MGGGAPSAPPDNSLEIERMRQEREDKAAAAAKLEADSNKTKALETARKNKATSRTTALAQLDDLLSNSGLPSSNPSFVPIKTKLQQQLDEQYNALGDDDADQISKGLAGLDPKKLAQNAIDTDLTKQRRGSLMDLEKYYNDSTATSRIGDTLDDPYIDEVLNEKYAQYATQLENSKKRGTLVGPGYEKALAALNQQREAGRATYQELGSSVLNEGRERINKIGASARDAANTADYTKVFTPATYEKQLNDYFNEFSGGLGGRIKGTVSAVDPFDFGEALVAGGIAQGPQAKGTSGVNLINPQSVLAGGGEDGATSANKKDKRGLDSQGTF